LPIPAVLDGEIAVFDAQGRSLFKPLLRRHRKFFTAADHTL